MRTFPMTLAALAVATITTLGLGSHAVSSAAVGSDIAGAASITQVHPAPLGAKTQPPDPDEKSGEHESNNAKAEGDTHEDAHGQDVEHQCPPNCDTAHGETP
ncbi:hypothetical protein [Nonomuraea sp. NPDC005501]|uniref:hypothetical protein n=1 Tax=Nonomuraea sp. NPDC005501 TaxID=3156884 RepID=UPI0033BF2520